MSSRVGKIRIDIATHKDYKRALSAEMIELCDKTSGEGLEMEYESMRIVFGSDFTVSDARRIILSRINRIQRKEEIADKDYQNRIYRIQFTLSTDDYDTLNSATKRIRADVENLGGIFTKTESPTELTYDYEIIFRD